MAAGGKKGSKLDGSRKKVRQERSWCCDQARVLIGRGCPYDQQLYSRKKQKLDQLNYSIRADNTHFPKLKHEGKLEAHKRRRHITYKDSVCLVLALKHTHEQFSTLPQWQGQEAHHLVAIC